MNHLEIQLQSFDKIHKNFRLWMTAEYHPEFPIGILEKSVKIVCEGPSGIQENIRQTHVQWKEKRLTKISTIDCKEKSNLLLILSWFHAKKNKNNNSIINIQNFKDDIATKQENNTGDKLTIDKASVNDNEMLTTKVENTDQLEGNLTANRHEMNIVKKRKDKKYNNNSG